VSAVSGVLGAKEHSDIQKEAVDDSQHSLQLIAENRNFTLSCSRKNLNNTRTQNKYRKHFLHFMLEEKGTNRLYVTDISAKIDEIDRLGVMSQNNSSHKHAVDLKFGN
jgi:hypothetical protein